MILARTKGQKLQKIDPDYVRKFEKALLEYVCNCGLTQNASDAFFASGYPISESDLDKNGIKTLDQLRVNQT
jgi:hypothetical protein